MRPALVTRPEPDGSRTARALEAAGVPALLWPLTEIRPLVGRIELPAGTDALLFTSANAVRAFAAACPERGLPALCVGARTAEVARAEGFARAESADGDAAALAALAARSPWRRYVNPTARESAADLAALLAPTGRKVTAIEVYEAAPAGAVPDEVDRALGRGAVGAVGIWSARNGELFAAFARAAGGWRLAATSAVAISPAAAAPLAGLGLARIEVVERPDGGRMLEGLIRAATGRGA